MTPSPQLSPTNQRHVAMWSRDPGVLADAAAEAAAIAAEGGDPHQFLFLWSIVGVPTVRWPKSRGPAPAGVMSLGDFVPVIAIDLATLGQ